MDMEIDTESAAAAVSQLFAIKKTDDVEKGMASLSSHRFDDDYDDGNEEDRESNKPSTSKWRNGIKCIAKGCPNRARDLTAWREELCKHGVQRANCECRSEQPFRLHHLNRSNHQLTMLYAALLLPRTAYKRIADNGCLPSYHWRVCSDHFHESQLGNQRAFPLLGIGKTHAEIREIVRELGMEDELPPNFDNISLEPQRLVPCFSFPRAPGQRRILGGNKKRSSLARMSKGTVRKEKEDEEEEIEEQTSEGDQHCGSGSEEGINNAAPNPASAEDSQKSEISKGEGKKRRYRSTSPLSTNAKRRKENERIRRHSTKAGIPCAVAQCGAYAGDEIADEGIQRPIRFFGLPTTYESAARWIFACKRDRSSRQYWMKRIKCMLRAGKRSFRSQNGFLVCECHFVDGKPTMFNPNPTLCIPSLSFENREDEKPRCIIAGCNVCGGMRNAKSKDNADYELYLLPTAGFERFKWLAAIRKGIPKFPTPSSHDKIYVCERHFSSKKFDVPVKHLVADEDQPSSESETSDSDSPEESNSNECNLSEEQKEKYRSLMSVVLERRPMFKCLVRCCPITNHVIKKDRLLPYAFFDLPRIPGVRERWLDALYISDPKFEFPPPLIGCGKYAVCERHFAVGKMGGNGSISRRLPLSIIPSWNLTPQDALSVDLDDTKMIQKSMHVKSISRCMHNNFDQQLRRELKALLKRWCCREVPEIHKIIIRLSSKIDRLYELIVQLCGVYGVEPTFPPVFDALEDDRVCRKGTMGSLLANDANTAALERALEGLMAITKCDQIDSSQSKIVESDANSGMIEKSNQIEGVKSETNHSVQENATINENILKTCEGFRSSLPTSPGSDCIVGQGIDSPKRERSDESIAVNSPTKDDKNNQIGLVHISNEGDDEGGSGVKMPDSDGEASICDHLDSEDHPAPEIHESINGESGDGGGGADEIAPSLSPHVEDGPPLLFTEADQLP